MSRVIQTDSVGKQRQTLVRALALAVRELMRQGTINAQTRDLVAFLVLAMEEIAQNIDETVKAWEKRGYWLKADRFRLDWEWTQVVSRRLRQALAEEDWEGIVPLVGEVASRVGHVQIPVRHRLGEPWRGAWEKLQSKPRPLLR
ncbi:hypothetical protein [uncultured Thermanaerothrix sp.]|uniref:hypothetical protein n=1 Tax=uncultured Thermanaerothrix sp. TaxID=1195149 RepID=UPI00262A4D82|nr:hypothetical protein [uncultured Thermanaerothrix sp.]